MGGVGLVLFVHWMREQGGKSRLRKRKGLCWRRGGHVDDDDDAPRRRLRRGQGYSLCPRRRMALLDSRGSLRRSGYGRRSGGGSLGRLGGGSSLYFGGLDGLGSLVLGSGSRLLLSGLLLSSSGSLSLLGALLGEETANTSRETSTELLLVGCGGLRRVLLLCFRGDLRVSEGGSERESEREGRRRRSA